MTRRAGQLKLGALALAATASLLLAACGGDEDWTSTSTDPDTLRFEAESGGLAYTATDVTAPASVKEIELYNPSSEPHDVVIEDGDGNEVASTEAISSNATATSEARLDPGTYTFYCSIGNHRDAGMEGTLKVTE